MGTGRGVILIAVTWAVACGGRSRSEHEMTSPDATGGAAAGSGATGGSGGTVANPSGGTSGGGVAPGSGGTTPAPACRRATEEYVTTSADECRELTFRCEPGAAAFTDPCGCGCDRSPFERSEGTPFGDVTLDCGGPSGVFAMFEGAPERLVIGETEVFAWVSQRALRGPTDAWAIDKRTGDVRLLPSGAMPVAMPGAVVSGGESIESNGVSYYQVRSTVMAETSEGRTPLFELPGNIPAFIVVDSELYATSDDGALYRGGVAPTVAPTLVEQRGNLDDDDYTLILGADGDAVYWMGGPYSDARVDDQDPLVLYRYCR